jgi:hypothetical protein
MAYRVPLCCPRTHVAMEKSTYHMPQRTSHSLTSTGHRLRLCDPLWEDGFLAICCRCIWTPNAGHEPRAPARRLHALVRLGCSIAFYSRPAARASQAGPVQSNGICLLDLVAQFHWNP